MSIIQPFYKFLHNEESHNLVMGTARGPGLGAAVGLALTDNVVIEITIGLLLGLVIGIARQKGKGLVIYFLLKSATRKRSQTQQVKTQTGFLDRQVIYLLSRVGIINYSKVQKMLEPQ